MSPPTAGKSLRNDPAPGVPGKTGAGRGLPSIPRPRPTREQSKSLGMASSSRRESGKAAPGIPGASGSGAALPGWGRGLGNSALGRKGQGKINRERLRELGHGWSRSSAHGTGHEDGTRGQHGGSTTRSTEPAMHAGKFPGGILRPSQPHGSPPTQPHGFQSKGAGAGTASPGIPLLSQPGESSQLREGFQKLWKPLGYPGIIAGRRGGNPWIPIFLLR